MNTGNGEYSFAEFIRAVNSRTHRLYLLVGGKSIVADLAPGPDIKVMSAEFAKAFPNTGHSPLYGQYLFLKNVEVEGGQRLPFMVVEVFNIYAYSAIPI